MRHSLDLMLRWGWQLREGFRLGLSAQTGCSLRDRDHRLPGGWHREPRDEWGDAVTSRPPASFENETTQREDPGADRRADTSPYGTGQRRWFDLNAV